MGRPLSSLKSASLVCLLCLLTLAQAHAALLLTSITPNTGVNTGSVSITNLAGTGFLPGATVALRNFLDPDIEATDVVVESSTKITCTLPITGAPAGEWTVLVTNPDGEYGRLPGFMITSPPTAPSVTGITPSTATNEGPVQISEVTGSDFSAGATVKLTRGGQADIPGWNVVVVSETQIRCTFDLTSKAVGAWTVVVTNPDLLSGSLTDGFAITQRTASIIYSASMDTNPTWSGAAAGKWEYGTPTGAGGDPSTGNTGTKVYGYNLSGKYPNSMANAEYIKTPAINCSGYTGVHLKFYRWLGVERALYDHANIQVSANGTTWTSVWANPVGSGAADNIVDTAWQLMDYDISAVADRQATVYVRWGMGTTNTLTNYCGWNIDDVRVTGSWVGPVVTSITPSVGLNTGTVAITEVAGTGFASGATVRLNKTGQSTINSTNVVVVSSTKITCVFDLTGKATGQWDVVVRNTDGLSSTLTKGFGIINPGPTVYSITPNWGMNTGPCDITNLEGYGFEAGATVALRKAGEADITGTDVVVESGTKITCTFDLTGRYGWDWDVVVTNPDGLSGTLSGAFDLHLLAPTVTGITPDTADNGNLGWTYFTISGTGFFPGATTKLRRFEPGWSDYWELNGNSVVVVNATTLTCRFLLGGLPTGAWDVQVTNGDAQSGTMYDALMVIYPAPTVTAITPDNGPAGATVSITDLAGTGFLNGATVALVKGGATIDATNVVVESASKITCDFDLSGAETGPWSISVTNTDGQSGTLAEGFTVTDSTAPTVLSWESRALHGGVVGDIYLPMANGFVEGRTSGLWSLRVTFSEAMYSGNITPAMVTVRNSANVDKSANVSAVSLAGGDTQLLITFSPALPDRETYTITLSNLITDVAGNALADPRSITCSALKGAANTDKVVDVGDQTKVTVNKYKPVTAATARCDLNRDGQIDVGDLTVVAVNKYHTCP